MFISLPCVLFSAHQIFITKILSYENLKPYSSIIALHSGLLCNADLIGGVIAYRPTELELLHFYRHTYANSIMGANMFETLTGF